MNTLDEIRTEIRRNNAEAMIVVSDVAAGYINDDIVRRAKKVLADEARLWTALAHEVEKALVPA